MTVPFSSDDRTELTAVELLEIEALMSGGVDAQAKFFDEYRDELKQMVRFRIDRRLTRRMDESDVLQEAFIEFTNRIDSYLASPIIPPLVWIRRLIRQLLSRQSRDHLGAQCRDLRRERYLSSTSLVNIDFLSESLTSVSSALNRMELRDSLQQAVGSMSAIEREILTLVHFENRSIREAALELSINNEAAKKRYRRALNRLKQCHEQNLRDYHPSSSECK